jgi:hypothetical protein
MLGSSCNPCCVGACKPIRIQNFLIGPGGQTDALQTFKTPEDCDITAVDSRGEYICQDISEVFGDYTGSEAFGDGKLCQYTRTMKGVTTLPISTIPPLWSQYGGAQCVPNTVRYKQQRAETITTLEIYPNHVTIATHGEVILNDVYLIQLGQSGTCQINGPTFFWCPEVEPGFIEWAAIKPAGCPAFPFCMRTIPEQLRTCSRSWTIPISDFTQDNFGTANGSRSYLTNLPGEFYSTVYRYSYGNPLCNPNPTLIPVEVTGPDGITLIPWVSLSAGKGCATEYDNEAAGLFYQSVLKVPSVVIT